MNAKAGFVFLGIIVGTILGGVCGYILFDDSSAQNVNSPGLVGQLEPNASANTRREVGERPDLSHSANDAQREEVDRDDDMPHDVELITASLDSLLSDAPPPKKRGGAGVIFGEVRDTAGNPVEGATVVIAGTSRVREPSRMGDGRPRTKPLSEQVRETVSSYYRKLEDSRDATTGKDGQFRFEGLRESEFEVRAYKVGYDCKAQGRAYVLVMTGRKVVFVASRLVEIPVSVMLPSGGVPRVAVIEYRSLPRDPKAQWSSQKWTQDFGAIRLETGSYEVKATLSPSQTRTYSGEELTSDVVEVECDGASSVEPLVFTLRGCPGIRGQIVYPFNEERPSASRVFAMRVTEGVEVDLNALANSDMSEWVSGVQSSFVFRDIQPGAYAVGASRNHRGPIEQHQVVNVTDSMVSIELKIEPADTESHLIVAVQDENGISMDKVGFTLRRESENGNATNSSSCQALRLQDGRYAVSPPEDLRGVLEATWDEGLSYGLVLKSMTHGEKKVDLEAGHPELLVQFERAATLELTLGGFIPAEHGGSIKARLEGVGHDPEYSDRSMSTGWTEEGTTLLGPVEVGSYRVVLSNTNFENPYGSSTEIGSQNVTLIPGKNKIGMSMPTLYSFTVSFPDTELGSTVCLKDQSNQENSHYSELGDTRKLSFKGLRAGSYSIVIYSQGMQELMAIEVPSTSTFVFVAQPINCLRVTIQDRTKLLGSAGLENGDLVVSINGIEFGSIMEIQAAMIGAMSGEKVVMGVLRGNRQFEVNLDAKSMMRGKDQGGSLEPDSR